jgi:hypothetical protein
MGNSSGNLYSQEYEIEETDQYDCSKEDDGWMIVQENLSHDPVRLESDIDYAKIYDKVSHLISSSDEDTDSNGFVVVEEEEGLPSSTEQPLILCRKDHHNVSSS